MRVLALDFGGARCGCAISDPTGTIATPLEAIPRPSTRSGMAGLARLVSEREVELVLVGLPLSLRGGDSAQTRAAREFARRLAARLPGIPVELHDERFTTAIARRTALDTPQGAEKTTSEDSRAAAHILESWLAARAAAEAPARAPGR
jgi:putative Holliday junction resolvase